MRRCSNILYLILCYFIDCETDDESVSDYEDEISWLKSLRPRSSWKPSEEQMMEEAAEGTVHNFSSNKPHPTVLVDAKGFNQGDKVRVIIVKEEDRDGEKEK